MQDVLGGGESWARDRPWTDERDPVCGMIVPDPDPEWTVTRNGDRYVFCSQSCRRKFRERPEHYLRALRPTGSDPDQKNPNQK
jgi:YHS domain-containing protein